MGRGGFPRQKTINAYTHQLKMIYKGVAGGQLLKNAYKLVFWKCTKVLSRGSIFKIIGIGHKGDKTLECHLSLNENQRDHEVMINDTWNSMTKLALSRLNSLRDRLLSNINSQKTTLPLIYIWKYTEGNVWITYVYKQKTLAHQFTLKILQQGIPYAAKGQNIKKKYGIFMKKYAFGARLTLN